LTAASSPKPITTCRSVLPPEIVMHDAYFGGRKSLVKPVTQQKTCNYIKLFSSSTRDCHAWRRIYRQTFRAALSY